MRSGYYYEYNTKRGIWQEIGRTYDKYVKYAISKGKPVQYYVGSFPVQSPSLYFDALVK
jgi:hypothetical protein